MKDIVFYLEGLDAVSISPWAFIGAELFMYCVPILFYVFRSIGLYSLAKRQGFSNLFLAWLPIVWLYVAGKLAGKILFGGKELKWFALVIVIIFGVAEALNLTIQIIANLPIVGYYLSGGEVYISDLATYESTLKGMGYAPYVFSDYTLFVRKSGTMGGIVYPYADLNTIGTILNILNLFGTIFDLLYTIGFVIIIIGLFRRFYPEHYLLATILSVFGLFGLFVFIIRKRSPVDFNEFMSARYQSYGMYGNHYQNYNVRHTGSKSPFEEFEDSSDEPFAEFDEDDK